MCLEKGEIESKWQHDANFARSREEVETRDRNQSGKREKHNLASRRSATVKVQSTPSHLSVHHCNRRSNVPERGGNSTIGGHVHKIINMRRHRTRVIVTSSARSSSRATVAACTTATCLGIGAATTKGLVMVLGAHGCNVGVVDGGEERDWRCLLYTSPSPRDGLLSRMPSSA